MMSKCYILVALLFILNIFGTIKGDPKKIALLRERLGLVGDASISDAELEKMLSDPKFSDMAENIMDDKFSKFGSNWIY